ncbi:putative aldehyde dehydrogenase [Phaeomoniella chlamydospora]|uniref:Putative aldehyde dehydrogenase n=1 Tax=Phaeomoniella chlamydospora TaxID=158046 RepID=A0A0G2DRI9_PHACM|nr:putative aldehyde dehydrogenase [Phaeomoniella chlamydospora]
MAQTNGTTNGHAGFYIPPKDAFIPLIIDGKDIKASSTDRHFRLPDDHDPTTPPPSTFQGTDKDLTLQAVESAQKAFPAWSATPPPQRRALLNALAQKIRENERPIRAMIKEEIHCNDFWTMIQYLGGLSAIEETAAAISSETMNGQIPYSIVPGAYPLVFNEPLGVILGIAPWNAPLILSLRAICAPLATGNTVILKGSEFSPRTHYFVANLVREVGFPPGVCNFLLHRPQDAVETFETIISHPAVKKANFTGSTGVGRAIAQGAAKYLKPVLLELGGKNITIVLDDANIDLAARESLDAATVNNGQVCMSTDTVLVHRSVAESFSAALHNALKATPHPELHVISSKGRQNLDKLLKEAESHGAKITQASPASSSGNLHPATLIENLPSHSIYHTTESFGPLLNIRVVDTEDEIVDLFHESGYGLSGSVFSKNHLRAINLAKRLDSGAIHINAGSVHDEGNFPHGGVGSSGYGRFGGCWGLREFTKTKTVMIYPDQQH